MTNNLHSLPFFTQAPKESPRFLSDEENFNQVIGDIPQAYEAIQEHLMLTPLLENPYLNKLVKGQVYYKPEGLQYSGSFKMRGALNAITQAQRRGISFKRIIAFSSGNHAQALAFLAEKLKVQTCIIVPEDLPDAKLQKVRRFSNVELIFYNRFTENREEIALAEYKKGEAILIPPFDHPWVVTGQGTIGLEIQQQLLKYNRTSCTYFLGNCSGGGLFSGVGGYLYHHSVIDHAIAVEPYGYDGMGASLREGRRITLPFPKESSSICDSLMSPAPGYWGFSLAYHMQASGITVSDPEVCDALAFAEEELGLVLEPGGAASLAAVLAKKVDLVNKSALLVLSGSNIKKERLAELTQKSLTSFA